MVVMERIHIVLWRPRIDDTDDISVHGSEQSAIEYTFRATMLRHNDPVKCSTQQGYYSFMKQVLGDKFPERKFVEYRFKIEDANRIVGMAQDREYDKTIEELTLQILDENDPKAKIDIVRRIAALERTPMSCNDVIGRYPDLIKEEVRKYQESGTHNSRMLDIFE